MSKTNTDYYTVKEFATRAGVTPQSVYKRLRDKPAFQAYVVKIDGKRMIHKSALNEYGIDADPEVIEPDNTPQNDLIQILREQLQAKDKQIEALTEALTNAQKLQAASEQRITALLEKKPDEPQKGQEGASACDTEHFTEAASYHEQMQTDILQTVADRRQMSTIVDNHKHTFFNRIKEWFRG